MAKLALQRFNLCRKNEVEKLRDVNIHPMNNFLWTREYVIERNSPFKHVKFYPHVPLGRTNPSLKIECSQKLGLYRVLRETVVGKKSQWK